MRIAPRSPLVLFVVAWLTIAGHERMCAAADEAAKSRVYGGIHFNFDTTSSFGMCIPLGEYIFANTFRPGLSHAGIYIGGGMQVHASDPTRGVLVSPIRRLIGAARPG